MKIKILGLIFLLITMTGFGFHIRYINNKLDSCTKHIDDIVDERGRYVDGFLRYRDLKQEWKVDLIAEGLGQLFKRIDLILYKKIKDVHIKSVKTARENLRFTKRKALEEFSFNIGGRSYSDSITRRFDSIRDVDYSSEVDYMNAIALKTDELYLEIRSRFEGKINVLQIELDEKRDLRSSYSQTRDVLYIVYMLFQVIGIALTILGEWRTETKVN